MPTASAAASSSGSGSGSGWKGEHWRGGAGYSDMYPVGSGGGGGGGRGGVSGSGQAQGAGQVRQDRWWHALCAWGSELDDGAEDGQVSLFLGGWVGFDKGIEPEIEIETLIWISPLGVFLLLDRQDGRTRSSRARFPAFDGKENH